ncbi:Adhesion G-protein coupled receptor G4 [Holothuria leucospilota]|uniref:Adhesion G-protein coupled receptor G4 n=1 Tax=Holothuria leucospilota TaxID=206669 RepID=A0A9Q1CE02_HOLLE|nr:Adhesion G-protein coupled receptor G4 [Holothuria leucospilota]
MEVNSQVIDQVTEVGSIPLMLEEQATSLLSLEHSYTEILSNVGGVALRVSQSAFKKGNISFGSYFPLTKSEESVVDLSWNTTHVYFNETESKDFMSIITLPSAFLDSIETVKVSQHDIPLSFFIFKDAKLFPMQTEIGVSVNVTDVISSQVISAAVAMKGISINNLLPNESVLARFYSSPIATGNEEKEERSCVYWKYNSTLGRGEWDTDGCEMVQSDERYVTCLCNHLTSFAVLVHVTTDPYKSNPILDIISLVGRILSIIGLSICVVTSLAMKDIRRKQLTQIHINLSVALIALYVTFSIGIKSTRDYIRCKITVSLIHFFCLSSMAWMSVEAFNMFAFLWTMRRNDIKHLLVIGSLFAWGFPFAVSLSMYLFDETTNYQGVNDYCFLHPGVSLYIGFLFPIFVLFFFNGVVFALITYRVSFRKIIATNEEARRKAEVARIKGPILFWILLGLSWIFGFLTILNTPLKILFEILFSVCLSLQGVFMFYMLTLNNPEIKVRLKRYRDLLTQAFERYITSQLPLRSFKSDQHVDVTVETQTASTNVMFSKI